MRYIELNPVRAGVVTHAGVYRWSSYTHNEAEGIDELITHHPVYESLGKAVDERTYSYRQLFYKHVDDSLIHEIRETTSRELVLGRDVFKMRIKDMTW